MLLKRFADNLTSLLIENEVVELDDQEICSYGLEVLIYNLISIVSVLILGVVFKALTLTLLFLITFVPLRSFTGGYHAKTAFKCFGISIFTFITIVFACKYVPSQIQITFGLVFSFLSTILIFTKTPIVNINKPKTVEEISKCNYISKYILFTILFFLFAFYSLGEQFTIYFFDISLSITAIAIAVLPSLSKGGETNES